MVIRSTWLCSLLLVGSLGCAVLRPLPEETTPAVAPEVLRADLHVHVNMRAALGPLFQGEPGEGVLAGSHTASLVNQVDAAALRRAGVRLIVATVWPPPATRPGRSALGEALHQLAELESFAQRNPDFVLAHSAAEARRKLADGQLVLIPAVEGGEGIRRIEDVDLLYAAGARSITLVHFFDNPLADAADDQFGALVGGLTNGRDGGLTALGVDAVRRMIQLGILIDVAHASDQTISEVLALAGPAGVPLLYSHTGAGWGETRCLSTPLAQRIGAGGGLIGIGLFRSPFQQVPLAERWEGFQPGTCDDDVAHWLHYAREVSPEAVMLGSDFSSVIFRARPGSACAQGLRHTGDLPALFAALEAHGIPRDNLDSSGERLLRLLETVEGRADPSVLQSARKLSVPRDDLFLDWAERAPQAR
ncbi:dipeptidase [Archangium lansingense]|uniref:Membrane dipeptidase n=1 Tax=Archangium lansingense TaxID=2995310 RepID=A0ABT4A8I8_9BACT|nr:membrane dipeptidase [Archangium lansinium]MCY1077646.1 membrane dipeptidase [Archangium lansinium]